MTKDELELHKKVIQMGKLIQDMKGNLDELNESFWLINKLVNSQLSSEVIDARIRVHLGNIARIING
jgi:hypothetical protein